jgi:26S proteasome regulatory subunit N12
MDAPSQRQWIILGLNLLRLLAKNKMDEFHTELELIPLEKHDNIYIKHNVQLEQVLLLFIIYVHQLVYDGGCL